MPYNKLSIDISVENFVSVFRDLLVTCLHAGLLLILFDPEEGGDIFFQKVGLPFNGLHVVIFQ